MQNFDGTERAILDSIEYWTNYVDQMEEKMDWFEAQMCGKSHLKSDFLKILTVCVIGLAIFMFEIWMICMVIF